MATRPTIQLGFVLSKSETLKLPDRTVLIRYPVRKVDSQLRIDDAPVLSPARPLLRNVNHGQVQHLEQAFIRRKYRLGFRYLPQLAVEALNGIGLSLIHICSFDSKCDPV